MGNLEFEKTIEHQFDSYCKKVIRNQARTIYAERKRRNKKFISLEQLNSYELIELGVQDVYQIDFLDFTIYNFDIYIKDWLIAQSIERLSRRQQAVILLSFFCDMTNVEIASIMDLSASTIHYHKTRALSELKKQIEEYANKK